jgi:hypothetical protein
VTRDDDDNNNNNNNIKLQNLFVKTLLLETQVIIVGRLSHAVEYFKISAHRCASKQIKRD